MLLNFYMVSEEYARDSFSDIEVRDGIWYSEIFDGTVDGWYMSRIYDPQSSIMIDVTGDYDFSREAIDLFDVIK